MNEKKLMSGEVVDRMKKFARINQIAKSHEELQMKLCICQ